MQTVKLFPSIFFKVQPQNFNVTNLLFLTIGKVSILISENEHTRKTCLRTLDVRHGDGPCGNLVMTFVALMDYFS